MRTPAQTLSTKPISLLTRCHSESDTGYDSDAEADNIADEQGRCHAHDKSVVNADTDSSEEN
jgi:hypothetical protein